MNGDETPNENLPYMCSSYGLNLHSFMVTFHHRVQRDKELKVRDVLDIHHFEQGYLLLR